MEKVVAIGGCTPPDQSVPETVRLLEDMLLKARSGEIRSVAIVGVKTNGHVVSAYHSEDQYYTLLGAASWLAHRMNESK